MRAVGGASARQISHFGPGLFLLEKRHCEQKYGSYFLTFWLTYRRTFGKALLTFCSGLFELSNSSRYSELYELLFLEPITF